MRLLAYDTKCFSKNYNLIQLLLSEIIMVRIDLNPSAGVVIESLRSIGYTLETAIADIIDNSISAGASRVQIMHRWLDGGKAWVAIADNGMGMREGELHEAMKLGGHFSNGDDSLGRFGFGLKTASISQCKRLTVVTSRGGDMCACVWDIDTAMRNNCWDAIILGKEKVLSDEFLHDVCEKLGAETGKDGTVIIWQNIDAEFNNSHDSFVDAFSHVRRHLALTFHRFLIREGRHAAIKIIINGLPLMPIYPFGPDNNINRLALDSDSIFNNGHAVNFYPYVLPRSDNYIDPTEYNSYAGEDGYVQNQGFYVYRNRRLIQHGTWFKLLRKSEKTQLLRIQVDFPSELDSQWEVNVMKSQISPPKEVKDSIKNLLARCSHVAEQQLLGVKTETCGYADNKRKTRDNLLAAVVDSETGELVYKIDTTVPSYARLFKHPGLTEDYKAHLRYYFQAISEEFAGMLRFTKPEKVAKEGDELDRARAIVTTLQQEGRSDDEIFIIISTCVPELSHEKIFQLINK